MKGLSSGYILQVHIWFIGIKMRYMRYNTKHVFAFVLDKLG